MGFKEVAQVTAEQGLAVTLCIVLTLSSLALLWYKERTSARERRETRTEYLVSLEKLTDKHEQERTRWFAGADKDNDKREQQAEKTNELLTQIKDAVSRFQFSNQVINVPPAEFIPQHSHVSTTAPKEGASQ